MVLLLLQICFCFVMREIACCLSDNNLADIIEAFNSIDDFGSLGFYLYTNIHYFNDSHALMLLNHLDLKIS